MRVNGAICQNEPNSCGSGDEKEKFEFKSITTTDSNHNEPIAENLLNRQFNPEQMNTAWVSDLTYLRVAND
jgi:transposase InsO family protein